MNLLVITDDESVGPQVPDCNVDVLVSYGDLPDEPRYLGCYEEVGIPCESCTHLSGFADRRLGCSANGIFECKIRNGEIEL